MKTLEKLICVPIFAYYLILKIKTMKYLFLKLTLLVFVFSLQSCSSDDDNVINNPIVGTWITFNNVETTEITFKSNKTVIENSTLKRNGAMREYVGSYSINDNKLTINWEKHKDYNSISREWSDYLIDKEAVILTFTIKDNIMTFLVM